MPPKAYVTVNSFNSGEVSPLVAFRTDIAKYNSACLQLENAMPLVEGGAKKMPGTYFAGTTKNNAKSRMVPFQFSTIQGAFLELSAGIIRIWEAAMEGSWSLGLATQAPSASNYSASNLSSTYHVASIVVAYGGEYATGSPPPNVTITGAGAGGATAQAHMTYIGYPGSGQWYVSNISVIFGGSFTGGATVTIDGDATAYAVMAGSGGGSPTSYIAGQVVLIGPFIQILSSTGTPAGNLYIAAPYGVTNASTVPITFSVNGSDALSVTITGTSPNQGINIALANATHANNAAALIQAAVRTLATLNPASGNIVDISQWTVTPDAVYFATPWILAPTQSGLSPWTWTSTSYIGQCVAPNQNDQFPLLSGIPAPVWNATYWEPFNPNTQPPIELTTPYLEEDLFALDCSPQSADVLWITNPKYPPAVVERLSANSWAYSLSLPGLQTNEPPYRGTTDVVKTGYSALGQNISLISQASPCVIVLASATGAQPFSNGDRVYINLCAGMAELNQGEYLVSGITYGSTIVTVIDSAGVSTTIATTAWYFTPQDPNTGVDISSASFLQYQGGGFAVKVVPMFAAAGDYPACATLYQERLCVGGTNNNPVQMNGSVQGDYPDFICDPNAEDFAVQFTLVSNKLDQILNMIGTPNALLIGSAGGIWVMAGANGGSLSQINVNAAKQSNLGVAPLQPQLLTDSAIFVSRSTRIVTFLVFDFATNQWNNFDLTRLNRNITIGPTAATSGIAQTAFQMEPYPIFWAVRNDGQLIGLVFNKQDQVFAWFRINMQPEGGNIESVAVISGANIEDQVVVVVNRTINGATVRYVEYFMQQELFGNLSNAFFVNAGQQWQGLPAVNITNITNANPCEVVAPAHGFPVGIKVRISGVQGMTQVNQDLTEAYTIEIVTTDTFCLTGIDSTAWGVYTGGGTVEQVANTVTGMSYLLGQSVVAVGDGALILQPTVVTSDSITFPYYANQITIGIPYDVTLQPTNPTLASQSGTTRGMKQKLDRVTLSLYQSMGGQIGTDPAHMYDITYGPGTMAKQPQMSTLEVTRDMDCDWTDESTFYIVQSDPFPFTLRGLVWRMNVNQD